jgi:hypothetical protein
MVSENASLKKIVIILSFKLVLAKYQCVVTIYIYV